MTKIQKKQYILKTILDKIFAILFLIMLSPVLVLVSILIKAESKGPVIFKQDRIGKNGKSFIIFKFRTMCDNAVNMGDGIFVSKDDKRITKVGKILRKTSLDELPQLINILKGDMSFIGPRPPLVNYPKEYKEYSTEEKLRFEILPGISGYAQVYGRNALTWPERIVMDIKYYRNYSLWLDLKILIATIITVFSFKGTYSGRSKKEKIENK